MVKKISKLALAGLVIAGATGVAHASEVYNNNGNVIDLSAKFQGYFVNDQYGSKTKQTAPVEMTGRLDTNAKYSTKISDDLTASAYISLHYWAMGYTEGPWGGLLTGVTDDANTQRLQLSEAHVDLTSVKYGALSLGNIYYTPYTNITSYSDVDIFIGTPANALPGYHNSFFTAQHTNGIMYTKSFIGDKLKVELFAQPGHETDPLNITKQTTADPITGKPKVTDQVDLQRNAGYSVDVQYKITDAINVGLLYTGTAYRVQHNVGSYPVDSNLKKSDNFNMVVGGLQYLKGGTQIGLTTSYQTYGYNDREYKKTTDDKFGVEFGASYDISGQQVGFRPSVQFDYVKAASSKDTIEKDGVKTEDTIKTTPFMATEVGLSYYVTPNLAYIAAAVIDIRSKTQIGKADHTNVDGTPNNYYGLGLMYKFN